MLLKRKSAQLDQAHMTVNALKSKDLNRGVDYNFISENPDRDHDHQTIEKYKRKYGQLKELIGEYREEVERYKQMLSKQNRDDRADVPRLPLKNNFTFGNQNNQNVQQ